jgi:hypothetical protein
MREDLQRAIEILEGKRQRLDDCIKTLRELSPDISAIATQQITPPHRSDR